MANFNKNVNRGIGYILNSIEFFIYRAGTIKEFARKIYDDLYLLTNTYRLFIQYKTTHRAKKMAGRCFLWDNSHGDHMANPGNGIELRSLNDASQDDCEGFGNPRFDGMESAILITDRYVFVYGDVKIEADSIRKDKKHVICTVSLCGSLVSYFRIPAQTFDSHFGLKENFPKQYDEIFVQAKAPYAEPFDAQVENDEQAETEAAQIVAETDPESTDDDETTKHTGEHKKPVCGDSRHDLNYPEIPNSWNNKEKTKTANFNDQVNSGIGYIMDSQEFVIYRTGTIKEFARMIYDELFPVG